MTDLKCIFSNVKINSESIGGVVLPDTCTHLLLNKQFLTLTCKVYLNEYAFSLLVDVRNHSPKTGWANVSEKTTMPMDLEMFFYIGKYPL